VTSNEYKAETYDVYNNLLKTYQFNVVFFQTPSVPSNIQKYAICDTFQDNDGIGQFDLINMDSQALNGLNPFNFTVSYYNTLADANAGTSQLPLLYTNSLQTETIYVRVENTLSNELKCFDVNSFTIQVNLLPEFELEDAYILCVNTNGTEEIPTPPLIDTGLNTANYSIVWSLNGLVLFSETDSVLLPFQEGNYIVEAMHIITGCSSTAITTVNLSSPPEVTAQVITYAFIVDNDIEAIATGIGEQEHEFSLDGGPWQGSPIFKNVSIGEHIITVRNLIGCGQTSIVKIVMDYPLYFTPNGMAIMTHGISLGYQNS